MFNYVTGGLWGITWSVIAGCMAFMLPAPDDLHTFRLRQWEEAAGARFVVIGSSTVRCLPNEALLGGAAVSSPGAKVQCLDWMTRDAVDHGAPLVIAGLTWLNMVSPQSCSAPALSEPSLMWRYQSRVRRMFIRPTPHQQEFPFVSGRLGTARVTQEQYVLRGVSLSAHSGDQWDILTWDNTGRQALIYEQWLTMDINDTAVWAPLLEWARTDYGVPLAVVILPHNPAHEAAGYLRPDVPASFAAGVQQLGVPVLDLQNTEEPVMFTDGWHQRRSISTASRIATWACAMLPVS